MFLFMTDYNWCMSCVASEIDVVELHLINRPKIGLKSHSRTYCLHNTLHRQLTTDAYDDG